MHVYRVCVCVNLALICALWTAEEALLCVPLANEVWLMGMRGRAFLVDAPPSVEMCPQGHSPGSISVAISAQDGAR